MTEAPSNDTPQSPAVRSADIRRGYDRPPSFTDLLPWVEYIPESRAFLLEDGVSVGALFELEPVGAEARTEAFMVQLRDAVQTALTEAIPELDDAPWILQVYVQDEPSLTRFQRGRRPMRSRAHATRPSPGTTRRPSPRIWRGSVGLAACSRMPRSPAPAGAVRPSVSVPCSIGA